MTLSEPPTVTSDIPATPDTTGNPDTSGQRATTPGTGTARWATITTPDGVFTLVANDEDVVLASGWTDDPAYLVALIHRSIRPEVIEQSTRLTALTGAVEAYYAGDFHAVGSVPVLQRTGGTFLGHAWNTLRKVEPGTTVSYTQLAELAGNPIAVRAAATTCSQNAAALFVPCHRVKRSDGTLGGFRYGLPLKRTLIDREAGTAGA